MRSATTRRARTRSSAGGPSSTPTTGRGRSAGATPTTSGSSSGSTRRSRRWTATASGSRRSPGADALSDALGFSAAGGVWVKDETGNVSGSHKARHLFGTLLELAVEEARATRPTRRRRRPHAPPLAIASCGNAALAAAVVARAADRRLDVFIPTDADPVGRGAAPRPRRRPARSASASPASPATRPTTRLLRAIAAGADPVHLPGQPQRPRHRGRRDARLGDGRGGRRARTGRRASTASSSRSAAARCSSSVIAGLRVRSGADAAAAPRRPDRRRSTRSPAPSSASRGPASPAGEPPATAVARADAAHHRSAFMWPWEEEPHSVAHGILDDETYDWLAVRRGHARQRRRRRSSSTRRRSSEANALARATTGIDVDHTGTAGLAGLLDLVRTGAVGPDETVAVLFTGAVRRPPRRRPATTRHPCGAPAPALAPRHERRNLMRSFLGRDILSLKDFSRDEFFRVFQVADDLRPVRPRPSQHGPAEGQDAADGVLPAQHADPALHRGGDASPRRARPRASPTRR